MLPKPLRDRLDLKSGNVLEFDEDLPDVKAVPRFVTWVCGSARFIWMLPARRGASFVPTATRAGHVSF